MGARFKALTEGVLMAPLDSRYTQVGFNIVSVQVCADYKKKYFAKSPTENAEVPPASSWFKDHLDTKTMHYAPIPMNSCDFVLFDTFSPI